MNTFKTLLKLAVVVVLVVVGIPIISKIRQRSQAAERAREARYWSETGFFHLLPEEAKNPTVAVMAPPNCPSEQAQKARALQSAIKAAGVPCEISDHLELTGSDMDDIKIRAKFMDGVENPLVVVRGWAKGSPNVSEVVAQYRATAGK